MVFLTGCLPADQSNPQPVGSFYFPSGLAFSRAAGGTEGVLYVANGNADKRYDRGSVVAVNLAALLDGGFRGFGSRNDGGGVFNVTALGIAPESSVQIDSFAGELASTTLPDGGFRLVVPSRSEGDRVQGIDVAGGTMLACVGVMDGGRWCGAGGVSLSANKDTTTGLPRAPGAYGIAIAPNNEAYVVHTSAADSPRGSAKDYQSYVAHMSAVSFAFGDDGFIPLGEGSGNSVAVGAKYLYVSGRFTLTRAAMLRFVDPVTTAVFDTTIEDSFRAFDARGLSLSTGEKRVFLATRSPDALLVLDVLGATSATPKVRLVRAVTMPAGPDQVRTIARPGRGDLVVVTCSSAGVVALYDDDIGDLAQVVPGVGLQPFDVAVDVRGSAARMFVSNFADGRVAVIDLEDFNRPELAHVVGWLGATQLCTTRPGRVDGCDGGVP